MEIIRVGVDLAKNVFQVHGVDHHERPVWQAQLKRRSWLQQLQMHVNPGAEVGLEACAGAHHWARCLVKLGYRVKLIAPQFVKPYIKSNKTDRNDAEAICEAMSRPTMRFVEPKTQAQQDIQAVHRIRSELVRQRTRKANQIRGLVGEYGLVAPVRLAPLRQAIAQWLEEADNGLSDLFRRVLLGMWEDLQRTEERVAELDAEIARIARQHPVVKRLQVVCGIGPIIGTAMLASLGDGSGFRRGRDFAVSLGLTPKQHSSGGKERLLGISKRGDGYLRQLLVHGARAAVRVAPGRADPLSLWIQRLLATKHPNVVTVAVANKLARIAWAMVYHQGEYTPTLAAAGSNA